MHAYKYVGVYALVKLGLNLVLSVYVTTFPYAPAPGTCFFFYICEISSMKVLRSGCFTTSVVFDFYLIVGS